MTNVVVENITKRYRQLTALSKVSFDIKDGEFFVLLGPTGAGKTTTLRVIAGLERQEEGSILFDGEPVDDLTPPERDIAFVFQQYSLYPTKTVYDNLAFPLRSPMRKTPESEIEVKVKATAEKLRIGHLLDRKTSHLSGGEMQRVSLGRALVRDPLIYLMDEPLSNLDAKLRESLRVELEHLQKVEGSTTLFVTHDQVEAMTMADRIAALDAGRVAQIGTPLEIYDHPATTFVAELVGSPKINLLPATRSDGQIRLAAGQIELSSGDFDLPDSVTIGIRPEDIQPDGDGEFVGKVALVEPLGVETVLHIEVGDKTLISTVPGMTPLQYGDEVRFNIIRERLHYFSPDDGARISAAAND